MSLDEEYLYTLISETLEEKKNNHTFLTTTNKTHFERT